MRTIAIINQKGGCGKTTTAINLGGIFARRGFRTLLVDMDPQSHCAAGLAIPEQRLEYDIGDAMLAAPGAHIDPSKLFWRACRNLDLAPSTMKLAGLEASRGGLAEAPDKERRLAGVLNRFGSNYDVCIIDCSPSIGLLTFNALVAAESVLIPVETSFFSLQGATKQVNTIRTLSKRLGSAVQYWLLGTVHEPESALARDLLEELKRRFDTKVVPVAIRRDPAVKEASSFGQPVIEYAPESDGARDYDALATWLMDTAGVSRDSRPRLPERLSVPLGASFPSHESSPEPPAAEVEVTTTAQAQSILAQRLIGRTKALQAAAQVRSLLAGATGAHRPPTPQAQPTPRVYSTPVPVVSLPERPLSLVETKPAQDAPKEPTANARALLGARATRQGVLFVQPISLGAEVYVAGDFNRWQSNEHRLRPNESQGVLELCLPMPAGQHAYRLHVDGHWRTDPFNPSTISNPFGGQNSVVAVPVHIEPRPAPRQELVPPMLAAAASDPRAEGSD